MIKKILLNRVSITLLVCVVFLIFLTYLVRIVCYKREKNITLTNREKNIVLISSFAAKDNTNCDCLRAILYNALDGGMSINEIKEILIQVYAYAGFPRSLTAINTFAEVLEQRKTEGKEDKIGEEPKNIPNNINKQAYADEVRAELFGMSGENKSSYAILVPTIDVFLKEHLFADIFYRGVLSNEDRELATISMLAAISDVEPMLRSHSQAFLKLGFNKTKLEDIIYFVRTKTNKEFGCQAEKYARTFVFNLIDNKN